MKKHLRIGPDGVPLYFRNQGLFSDTSFLTSIKNTKHSEYWNTEKLPHFKKCYENILELTEKYEDLSKFNEAELEDRWIRPVLTNLGYVYAPQPSIGKCKPDYALFASDTHYEKAKLSQSKYTNHVLAILEAKKITCSPGALDGIPSYQITRYLESTGKTWGILTNGQYWRLYSLKANETASSFYEINLTAILAKKDPSRFKYFYNFFRKEAMVPMPNSGKSFLDIVFDEGKDYDIEIEKNLKDRVFESLEQFCRGIVEYNHIPKSKLKEVYDQSLHYIFRILFVLNCESKGLLNTDRTLDYYPYSLRKLITSLKKQYENSINWSNKSTKTFGEILQTFKIIEKGDERIGVHGMGSELFYDSNNFFKQNKISDFFLNKILIKLAYDYDSNKTLQLIDYKRSSVDHLGSIFEGLLEYNLGYINKKLCLLHNNKDRKKSGSYYTPQDIVDYIVKESIGPICKNTQESILSLKICDPACGSGHFLIGVIKYLEKRMQKIICDNSKGYLDIDVAEIRWKILNNCIFGADINPLAIKLTKLSLWMYTARKDSPLEPLDDQFICGNSLHEDEKLNGFVWQKIFPKVFDKGGFDAIVGNPPYIFTRYKKISKEEKQLYSKYQVSNFQKNTYSLFVEKSFELLNKNGNLGFIIPKNWMTISTMKLFRQMLTTKSCNLTIVNHTYSVFKGVSVDTSVIISKSKGKRELYLYESCKPNEVKLIDRRCLKDISNGRVVNFNKLDEQSINIMSKIEHNSKKLEDLAIIKSGLEDYGQGKGDPPQTKQMMNQRIYHAKEKKDITYKKCLGRAQIERYYTKWSGYYLKYGKNLSGPRKISLFQGERILVRQIPAKPPYSIVSALVTEEILSDRNYMIIKNNSDYDIRFILAVINSRIITYWFNTTFQKLQRKTQPQFKITELKTFPIPNLKSKRDFKLCKEIIDEVKKIESYTKQTKQFRLSNENIDKKLVKLFNLSIEDIQFIERYQEEQEKGQIEKIEAREDKKQRSLNKL